MTNTYGIADRLANDPMAFVGIEDIRMLARAYLIALPIVEAVAPMFTGIKAGDDVATMLEWMEGRDWSRLYEALKKADRFYA